MQHSYFLLVELISVNIAAIGAMPPCYGKDIIYKDTARAISESQLSRMEKSSFQNDLYEAYKKPFTTNYYEIAEASNLNRTSIN